MRICGACGRCALCRAEGPDCEAYQELDLAEGPDLSHRARRALYRHIDPVVKRSTVLAEARRVRDALSSAPRIYNVAGVIGSSQEIVDTLTLCLLELEGAPVAEATL